MAVSRNISGSRVRQKMRGMIKKSTLTPSKAVDESEANHVLKTKWKPPLRTISVWKSRFCVPPPS